MRRLTLNCLRRPLNALRRARHAPTAAGHALRPVGDRTDRMKGKAARARVRRAKGRCRVGWSTRAASYSAATAEEISLLVTGVANGLLNREGWYVFSSRGNPSS